MCFCRFARNCLLFDFTAAVIEDNGSGWQGVRAKTVALMLVQWPAELLFNVM